MNNLRKEIFFIFLFALFFVSSGNCFAVEKVNTGLQMSPLRFDVQVYPGDQKEGKAYIRNDFDKTIMVDVDVQDFSIDDSKKLADPTFFVPNQNHNLKAYDVINWIDIDKTSFQLEPQGVKEIPFKIKIPIKTPTAGYYGVIFFKQRAFDPEGKGAISLSVENRLGLLVTLAVKGDQPVNEQGTIKVFNPLKKIFIDNPIGFDGQVYNSGNFPYKLSGDIDIYKGENKVSTLDVPSRMFYPEKTRRLDDLSWNASIYEIGKYTAKLHLISEDGNVTMDKETSFLIIPWKVVAAAVFVLILIMVVFYAGGATVKRKKAKK
jgi:hypothetical protein